MHSAEPIEPRLVSDPSPQAVGNETWRNEVASRVEGYRARRKRKSGEENSAALDLGLAAAAMDFESQRPHGQGTQSQGTRAGAEPRSSALPARKAFDTNYYRRLNAELMAQQSSSVTMGATAKAIVPDQLKEDFEAENDAGIGEKLCDELRDETCGVLALDLEIRPRLAGDSFLEGYCISEPEPELAIAPPVPLAVPLAPRNLIIFRRPFLEPPLLPQPSRDELAEPMRNRPRILEVPEDILPAVQGSLFPEIRLDADEQETSDTRDPEIKMALPVALVSERLLASLTDLGVVMAASLLFAGMAWRALPEIPHTKPFWIVLGAVTLLLWAVYQHLFLLYAGRTFGMSVRGIRLSTFDGGVPKWKQRRSRAHFMFISFASVTLGFLWALVDEDTLCWHDRISQTFPTTE